MRRMVLLVAVGLVAGAAAAEPAALTFDDLVRFALGDSARLTRQAELARWDREVASMGRLAREGPTLDAELGPRRVDSGARKVDASARIEVPLLSGGRARVAADSRLRSAGPDILAAGSVESRLRLRAAYLDAWFEQERLEVIGAQVQAIEQILASVRKRVEGGADAPYEGALVEGERLRALSESDAARAARGDAWSALRALAELPTEPGNVASPGWPPLTIPDDAQSRFEAGLLNRSVAERGSLGAALLALEHAQRRSRWSAAATVGTEGEESYATVGAAYRFPLRGEDAALGRERATAGAALARGSELEAARLATRFATAVERARRFGPITPPDAFDDALRAVALRLELGKDRPSVALPVRRQLLEARGAALRRIRDAHLLIAELDALMAGDAP